LESRFKIQGSETNWIQDSRLRKKNFFHPLWVQEKSSIQPFWIQDSRLRKNIQSNLFGFKIQDSRLKAFGFKKFLLAS
jgi:hypothetical protein